MATIYLEDIDLRCEVDCFPDELTVRHAPRLTSRADGSLHRIEPARPVEVYQRTDEWRDGARVYRVPQKH